MRWRAIAAESNKNQLRRCGETGANFGLRLVLAALLGGFFIFVIARPAGRAFFYIMWDEMNAIRINVARASSLNGKPIFG
jgi:hypothetical protein